MEDLIIVNQILSSQTRKKNKGFLTPEINRLKHDFQTFDDVCKSGVSKRVKGIFSGTP